MEATYRILRGDDGLILDVNGVLTYPLEGRDPDTLVGGWLTLTFWREGGAVVGFRAGSGRAGGIVFERR